MNDKLMEIYNVLKANPVIAEKCENRIKFYEYPETADTSKAFMIITPLDIPSAFLYGSNDELSVEFMYQVDVQSHSRQETKEIQIAVKNTLRENDFKQLSGGLDRYFSETKRYVDARRYKGISKLYKTDY
ncbi:MAG: hypothetical protein L0K82_03490 [Pisciglobus halotolerans]|nr:hypothetical protein [Pisciglobus halotolerans]